MKAEHLHLRFRALIRENTDLTNACLIWPRAGGTVEFSGSVNLDPNSSNRVLFHTALVEASPIGFGGHNIASITISRYSPGITITLKP